MASVQVAPVPPLADLVPREVFQKSTTKAIWSLIKILSFVTLGVVIVANIPWYLLPIGWLFLGTSVTGLLTVAYACSNDAFFENNTVNDIVGTLCLLPLMTPFQSWRQYFNKSRLLSSPFWFFASSWQWAKAQVSAHLNLNKRTAVNMVLIYAFVCLFFPLMAMNLGWWGLFKYYFIPLAVYHFWASSFQKAHQLPHATILKAAEERYNEYKEHISNATEQLQKDFENAKEQFQKDFNSAKKDLEFSFSTVKFPKWVELLSDNLNYMAVAASDNIQSIPSYNIKKAYASMQKKLDKSIQETSLWKYLYADDSTGLSISTLFTKLDWTVTIWLVVSTICGIIAPFFIDIQIKTAILAFIMFYVGGVGITSGYHRLWSHRSYDAHFIVKLPLLIMATWTFEGSCFSWCHDHRIHHRFTDTKKDPYNAKQGFFHSHIGWMFWKRDAWGPNFHEIVKTDISDLEADPLLQFQHRYYAPLAIGLGLVMPMMIAGFGWGDWLGGLLIAGFTKAVFIQQFTFFINSLAHYWGDATYSDQRTPRDSIFVSLWTWGEGFHNFHHEFPYDYRNGLLWYHYDPGKWIIYTLSKVGLTYNLKKFKKDLFAKGRINMIQKKVDQEKSKFNWGRSYDELPEMSMQQYQSRVAEGASLILIDDVIHDVTEFIDQHPGGRKLIQAYLGKDATQAFNETVYNHSNAARNELACLRVARLTKASDDKRKAPD